MIIVDSGVWIDYFNGVVTSQTDKLDTLLDVEPLVVGDIILTEVLQGFRQDDDYKLAKSLMTSLIIVDMLGVANAVRCAESYRMLRKRGITIRKTIDVIIATYCIDHACPLLFEDKDFLPFVEHLGLVAV
jgi:predicted nucleic acid-binding protein